MKHEFTNVAMYLSSEFMGNIYRINCRMLTVETEQHYAQYSNAIRVQWLEEGKRKQRATILTYKPFLVVLPLAVAVNPDKMCSVVIPSAHGVTVTTSKYHSFDDGWENDFRAILTANNLTPLFDVATMKREME